MPCLTWWWFASASPALTWPGKKAGSECAGSAKYTAATTRSRHPASAASSAGIREVVVMTREGGRRFLNET